MTIDEKKYLMELKNGSHETFSMIYHLYADKIYHFSFVRTKNKDLSQDIVQDTFLKLWQSRKTLSPEGNLKSFIFTIARNLIIDSFRKQIDCIEFDDYIESFSHVSTLTSPEEQLHYEDLKRKLSYCKSRLTTRECEIFELSREKGLSTDKIAEKLKLSPQTVKNHLSSSLRVFRSELLNKIFWFF